MGLFSRLKRKKSTAFTTAFQEPTPVLGPDYTSKLPNNVLRNIFSYVCPHTRDFTFEPCENSMVGDGCMLCDLRDLSNCARTTRQWYHVAQEMLYQSIRIDAVHYCELEEILNDRRKRRSRSDTTDIPAVRLSLLSRTLREHQTLAYTVQWLKLPVMTRETCKADLARTVSVLPNLLYVDLPEGFFSGNPSCHTLRQELQASCQQIRKMRFAHGAEQLFELLLNGYWQHLEVLELDELKIEPITLRRILATLPDLETLTILDSPWLGDAIFENAVSVPPFPALETLKIVRSPSITVAGLERYLSRPDTRARLGKLFLEGTDVQVAELHRVLDSATNIRDLALSAEVRTPLLMEARPPLFSASLKTMHFEITSARDALQGLQPPASSYYAYLITSLLTNSLPRLRELWVYDPDFAETLTLAPPMPSYARHGNGNGNGNGAPHQGFHQPLEVYAKGVDEHDWIFNKVHGDGAPGDRGSLSLSGGRPLSAYSAQQGLGPQWGGGERKSMVVGNGFGGYLAVPVEEPQRPSTSSGGVRPRPSIPSMYQGHTRTRSEKRASRADLWR
ncbi:F-box domain-containing protein [Saccharata proteae CBS 121410]|uniref:F-box domain-containing protein n=1 Tax=Saccharata proteae CBS 121410 TaxID=1314787 RepID=A0A9P4HS60_9PEZI|nr:F-box domain-containing protein [Saccharata proteae CBS 121410]